ncbi:MerR family transcriptional regulator [Streptomyces sp. SID13031]|uniref:MerR family transcriptional regulator n=1 Tax=Streptomyces sp. SID13031 TaxID=2706046 RepID=UPI0013C73309|nr:MerR family transcriptional regulator [Streptomyces sp. SID13031]NEA33536.1 MerR family transcriptional regulator [Streptomyces sp. SID13031]
MNAVPTPADSLTVGATARRLGIAAPTLRSWERRYGLSPSARSAGGHRRYSPEDLARLRAMLRLIDQGVATAEAAASVRDRIYPTQSPTVTSATSVADGTRTRSHGVPKPVPVRRSARTRTDGPGKLADLFQLANAMDGDRLTHEVARSLDMSGAVDAWTSRLMPLLVEVGDQWERTGACVEVEHLASDAVAGGLRYHTRRNVERHRPDETERAVVLACLEREDHALPLLAVAAALAERGVRVRTLGAATPVNSLSDAVRRIRPAAVFIWSSASETADLDALRGLARTRPSYHLVVGGPGWQTLGEPDGWVNSLAEAVTTLVSAVRP